MRNSFFLTSCIDANRSGCPQKAKDARADVVAGMVTHIKEALLAVLQISKTDEKLLGKDGKKTLLVSQ